MAARASSSRERPLAMGESFADGPVHVSVLHPERPDWERRRVRNDDSVVLWVRFGDVGVLLPGDIGQAVEARVASRIAAAPLTVVRLAHHGSASSTSHALLDALRPALAIGSMARGNRFGHPSAGRRASPGRQAHSAAAHRSGRRDSAGDQRARAAGADDDGHRGEPHGWLASARLVACHAASI